ncbi:YbhB/YbcL family Raf kinase inhibitor-like protein [bacterium]|nr:YbhB/YbcL family Raf kinase inhibitor-like protein [bacterium]
MLLQSKTLTENAAIPKQHTAQGGNISPSFLWSDVPLHTISLALILADVDSPISKRFHWGLCNIPPLTDELGKNIDDLFRLPNGMIQVVNDMGRTGYYGPGFPAGQHRYIFRLFAVDMQLELSRMTTCGDMLKKIKGHILAFDTITVHYAQPAGLTLSL